MKKNRSTATKREDIVRNWHFIDVEGKILGRAASDIAKILIGKNKADYTPNLDIADNVVVLNAGKIEVTGNKLEDKIYKKPTGFPGSVTTESLGKLMQRRPTEALRRAVKGMLPKNKLTKKRITHLFIYEGTEHPHIAQEGAFKKNKEAK
jgi:large subunit ribosomal protein L13